MMSFELLPEGSRQRNNNAQVISWHRFGGEAKDVKSTCSWDLYELGPISSTAGDLFRIATAAYLADRLSSRGNFFSRDISLTVHIVDLIPWSADVISELTNLLNWLTGDHWSIKLKRDNRSAPPNTLELNLAPLDEVTLLSGGLDSFCGAVDRLDDGKSRLFVGHTDGTAAVQRAQNEMRQFLHQAYPARTPGYRTVLLTNTGKKIEASTRSRSLLFMTLATAIASAQGSQHVVVPENGFTSINLPLNPARGGALSTRSTHPTTFQRMNSLLDKLGIDLTASNPYQQFTKGEFVRHANKKLPDLFTEQLGRTVSCGKLDGTYYKGGDPNLGCGLCIPCIVRRASIIAAGITDPTSYLSTHLTGSSLRKLLRSRQVDTYAMNDALAHTVSENDILSCGPWPDDFDINAGLALYERGMSEIRRLELPI